MNALTLLRKGDLFSTLSSAALSRLASVSEVKLIEAGNRVVRAGASHVAVGYLAQGKVAFYRRNPKRDITLLLGVVEAPGLFGDAELAAGTPWMVSVAAEEDVWCVWIPNQPFLDTVRSDAELATRLYLDASVRHILVNHTAQTMALYDVETRLIRLLLDYAQRYGRSDGDTVIIERPITQVDMAAALGVTRQTISRTLGPLEKRGTVERGDGTITLRGLAQLEADLPRDLLGFSHRPGGTVTTVTKRCKADDVE
jgi:CRP/FNR family transcriptional regulator